MLFITGGIASGKRTYAASLGFGPEMFAKCDRAGAVPEAPVVYDAQLLAWEDASDDALRHIVLELAEKEIVIATEVGAGIVPIDADERRFRERAGRLACMLAERADSMVRLCCGIPQRLKG